ncbi:MAG: DUF2634 domain-containing protein [Oscillospiraceae bacterium]|jgi:hypothetical protein|nr:DUF2634 domain-containing protein [Oscillospiraceae bacterium]
MKVVKAFSVSAVAPEDALRPSRTYWMDFGNCCIQGACDRLEALRQFIRKALCTERFAFLIYDAQYGSEIRRVQTAEHQSPALVASELELAVRDALIHDDRIEDVSDFSYSMTRDRLYLSFTVKSVFGALQIEEVF